MKNFDAFYAFDRKRLRAGCGWYERPQTLGEFVDESIGFLRKLQAVHPMFRQPLAMTGTTAKEREPLAEDLSNVEACVRRFGWDRKAPKEWFTGLLPDKTLARDATSQLGFRISLSSGGGTTKPDTVNIRITGGGNSAGMQSGSASVELPAEGSDAFYSYSTMRELLRLMVDYWRPELARVSTSGFDRLVDFDEPPYPVRVGWMNYSSDPKICGAVPQDVECEPFGPGGALITLQKEVISADDPQAVAKAIRVRDALLPGGWLAYKAMLATLEQDRASDARYAAARAQRALESAPTKQQ
jgi:Immunity protein 52